MREQFFEIKTETLKENRAVGQHTQTLLVKSLVALKLQT